MNTVNSDLQTEAVKFSKQLLARYGLPLLQSKYESPDKCAMSVTTGLAKNNTTADEFRAVREWLLRGLQPFLEYPPTLEAVIQLANLVKTYPVTDYTLGMGDAWYRLNTEYGQRYGRMWKGESAFDLLIKERVWLAECEKTLVTQSEMLGAMRRLTESTLFRTYPPKLEEFMGSVLAVRCSNAPLIEEAWLMALAAHVGSEIHPLVKRARGMVGAVEINLHVSESEKKFKKIYQDLLLLNPQDEAEIVTIEAPSYLDKSDVLSIFGDNG